MHKKYHNKWYSTLTFVQKTEKFDEEGKALPIETWYEALQSPGNLCIKFEDLQGDNGVVFRGDSMYIIQEGEILNQRPLLHSLLILGFDVYFNDPEVTKQQLATLNFDLKKQYTTVHEGRTVYVVGATSPEDKSNQFWIDKQRLYFIKSITYNPNGNTAEVDFLEYQKVNKGWIAPKVVMKRNGKISMIETYSDIKTGVNLDPLIFDPLHFKEVNW